MIVWSILLTLLLAGTSHGKAVFAHFMVFYDPTEGKLLLKRC
jgi:hypothetical protein